MHQHSRALRNPIFVLIQLVKNRTEHSSEQQGGGGAEAISEEISRGLFPLPGDEQSELREPGRVVLASGGTPGVEGGEEEVVF